MFTHCGEIVFINLNTGTAGVYWLCVFSAGSREIYRGLLSLN